MYRNTSCLRVAVAACAVNLSLCTVTFAQQPSTTNASEEQLEELIVRAHPLAPDTLAQPVKLLSDKELQRALAPSIAETLRDVPGVHSASFGHAVGRPVIRGLGGARVKTMEDRIDSMDVSVSSPDHLTTIEPFTAESIEVLKGPSTLLYGTGAIGGVVNVNTGRIPQSVSENVSAKAELRSSDNANQQTGAARLDGGAGAVAFHLDAFYRDADEYDIPGFAESSALRAQEEPESTDEHEGEHEGEEEAFGTLPGSQMKSSGGAFGLSRVGEQSVVGIVVSTYKANYGLPGGHGHEHEHDDEDETASENEEEEGTPVLDLSQTRIDAEANFEAPFSGFKNMNVRLGHNDYEHTEIEGNGEGGTVFATEALEGRLELLHENVFGFEGATGLQVSSRKFSALGEEAFVEPVETQTLGIFYVGQRNFGDTGLEFGLRYEHIEHDPSGSSTRRFDLGAASIGVIQPLADNWTLSAQLDYSSRAPVAEELYSNGAHLATRSYEIGSSNLEKERAANVSASLTYKRDSLNFALNAYRTRFEDFIFEVVTGEEIDELPVLRWSQNDATVSGMEIDFGWKALTWKNGSLSLNTGYDLVRARLSSGENRNLPRIPPSRLRIGTVFNWQNTFAEVTWSRVDAQRDTALGELPTEAYNDLGLHLAYELNLGGNSLELFLTGRNLTNDEQRYHASFIKDLAPQPGRTIEAGLVFRL